MVLADPFDAPNPDQLDADVIASVALAGKLHERLSGGGEVRMLRNWPGECVFRGFHSNEKFRSEIEAARVPVRRADCPEFVLLD